MGWSRASTHTLGVTLVIANPATLVALKEVEALKAAAASATVEVWLRVCWGWTKSCGVVSGTLVECGNRGREG